MNPKEIKILCREKVEKSPYGYAKALSPWKSQIMELGCGRNFKESVYNILNPDAHKTCGVCGKTPTPFQNITVGYSITCSKKCAAASGHSNALQAIKLNQDEVVAKRKQTLLEKTGYDSPMKNPDIRKKFVDTSIERYGTTHPNKSDMMKDAERQRCLDSYGVESYFETDVMRQASSERIKRIRENGHLKKVLLERYGVDNWSLSEDGIRHMLSQKGIERLYDDLPKLIDEGKYISQVCEEYGASRHVVKRLIDVMGLEYEEPYHCSHFQKHVFDYVKSLAPDAVMDDRIVLGGKEIDVLVASASIGVECNGMFYHSDRYKDKGYHKEKYLASLAAGFQLIQIDDMAFNEDKSKWLDFISAKMGIFDRVIWARKCEVREIDTSTLKAFTDANHAQGHVDASRRYGMFLGDELVSIMTFNKPRFNKDHDFELVRFCVSRKTTIVGGFAKLLRHFERTCAKGHKILSYANCMWSIGKVYRDHGFVCMGHTEPNYVWFNGKKTMSRYQTQKHKLIADFGEENVDSEDGFMRSIGFFKYYDAGNLIFSKEIV